MFKRAKMIKLVFELELELLMFYRVNSLIYIPICVYSMFLDSMKMRGGKTINEKLKKTRILKIRKLHKYIELVVSVKLN